MSLELPNLYSITGNITDVNTLLINRNELRELIEAEREECAKLCETNADRWPDTSKVYAAIECAYAIRARGTP